MLSKHCWGETALCWNQLEQDTEIHTHMYTPLNTKLLYHADNVIRVNLEAKQASLNSV